MADSLHPQAAHNVPAFITAPGQTDVLMVITALILLLAVVAFGVLYFRLHSLPEQIAHKSKRVQMELVAVLGLIALFTHMHIFWIAGLILAFIDLPDFGTPLRRIAGSLERIAGVEPRPDTAEITHEVIADAEHGHVPAQTPLEVMEDKRGDGAVVLPKKPAIAAETNKERSHA